MRGYNVFADACELRSQMHGTAFNYDDSEHQQSSHLICVRLVMKFSRKKHMNNISIQDRTVRQDESNYLWKFSKFLFSSLQDYEML